MLIEEFFDKINAPGITRNMILHRTDIKTTDDLMKYTAADLKRLPNFGLKSLRIVEQGLQELGLGHLRNYNPIRMPLKLDTPENKMFKECIKELVYLKATLSSQIKSIDKKIQKFEQMIKDEGDCL